MKKALGNSCVGWCLAYIIAFIALAAVSTWGLAGLKTRFGASTQVIGSSLPAANAAQGAQAATTPQPPAPAQSAPIISVATEPPQQQPVIQATPLAPGPVQTQSGVISGDSSAPFYIIQVGDTLWSIAQQYGVTVDALKRANGLSDNVIVPGQLLYLPVAGSGQ